MTAAETVNEKHNKIVSEIPGTAQCTTRLDDLVGWLWQVCQI